MDRGIVERFGPIKVVITIIILIVLIVAFILLVSYLSHPPVYGPPKSSDVRSAN
jgi:hypothetical protein